MVTTKRLGRGLSALIPDLSTETNHQAKGGSIHEVEISRIVANPFQPRTDFDPQALAELKQSISENGLVTPITVRPYDNGYQLIAGERRFRAVQELGYERIPAYILEIRDDRQMLEMALIENVQRENLNPVEEARGYQRLIDECNLTQETVAQKVGKDRVTIANSLRLLKLPDSIQESLRKGELTAGHARALLGLPERSQQIDLWKTILKNGWSVRQVERFVQRVAKPKSTVKKKSSPTTPYAIRETEDKLRRIFGTQVRIHLQGKGGKIELEFYSENDLERLLELMQKI
ncbi:MAG: ParB/RepB/Spo0J family partition protein [candidate division KSB1 bacterium]|nr:ParB/RepB/Spo0J family partition protein [candidate division KSB1 bacterium]MDZ7369212.1 ParB/RepB/Spo0J family partition protein [candidate division KSB1 bacterium]MDZ7407210.1 ParB/RepB/Spo0J family partition protein [candidate division KSB1 bacterium]